MDYSPKHKQPFTLTQASELDIPTITKEIERLENSLFHLHRTQTELNEHLSGSMGEDRELLDVIKENEDVIASQKERITMLNLALEEKGVNARSGHYDSSEVDDGTSDTATQRTQSTTTTGNEDSRQHEHDEREQRDDGVYL
ncbi:hypothetical protein ACEPAF_6947 [Sanghuangporus sanghuang]